MTAELAKRDIMSMIKGIEVHPDKIPESVLKYGSRTYDWVRPYWVWNLYLLERMTEEELWDIYRLCRDVRS